MPLARSLARSLKTQLQNFSVFDSSALFTWQQWQSIFKIWRCRFFDWPVLATWPQWPSIFEIWCCFPWFLLFPFNFLSRLVIRKFNLSNCRISITWLKLTNQEARICVFAYFAILAIRSLDQNANAKFLGFWLVSSGHVTTRTVHIWDLMLFSLISIVYFQFSH